MATDVERLVVRLEGRIRDFERSMQRANASANKAATGIERRFARTNTQLRTQFAQTGTIFSRGFGGIGATLGVGGAFGLAALARGTVGAADTITEATNQIKAAFAARGITDNVDRVRDSLQDLAVDTRSDFGSTVELFTRLTRATESINAPVADVIRATQILNRAFQASGASAQEAANGVRQLAQGLASGALQGDELRSIRENAPVIAKAIADAFGTTIGGLKQLGSEGKLTAETVFPAILAGGAEIDRQFAETTLTIGKGFGQIGTRAAEFVGKLSEVSGAGENVATSLGVVAERIDQFGDSVVGFLDGTVDAFDAVEDRANQLGNSSVWRQLADVFGADPTNLPEGTRLLDPGDIADTQSRLQQKVKLFDELAAQAAETAAEIRAIGPVLDFRVDLQRAALERELNEIVRQKDAAEQAINQLRSLLGQSLLKIGDATIPNLSRDVRELLSRLGTEAATALDFKRVGDQIETELNARLGTTVETLGDVKDASAEAGQSLVDSFGSAGRSIQGALDILHGFFLAASNPPTPLFSALGQTTGQAAPTPLRSGESVRPLSERGGTFANDPRVGEIAANTGTTATNTAQTTSGVQNLGPQFQQATSGIPTAIGQGAAETSSAVAAGAAGIEGAVNTSGSGIEGAIGKQTSTLASAIRGISFQFSGLGLPGGPSQPISAGNIDPNSPNYDPILARSLETRGPYGQRGYSGGVGFYASGGPIRGSGTGTSDSIPANLPEGGYIMRASAVRNYGVAFMESLGRDGYADGGAVRKVPAMVSNGEFLLEPSVVKRHGVGVLDAINEERVPKFASGGVVHPADSFGWRISTKYSEEELERMADRLNLYRSWEINPYSAVSAGSRLDAWAEKGLADGTVFRHPDGTLRMAAAWEQAPSDTGGATAAAATGSGSLTEAEFEANQRALRRFADAISPTGRSTLEGPRGMPAADNNERERERNRRRRSTDRDRGRDFADTVQRALGFDFEIPEQMIPEAAAVGRAEEMTGRFAAAASSGRSPSDGPRQTQVDRSVNTPVNVMIEGVRRDEVEIIAEMVFERASRELATRLYLN